MTAKEREIWMGLIADARQSFDQLPKDSWLREALPDGSLADMERAIEGAEEPRTPPFFGFLLKAQDSQVREAMLKALERDLDIVIKSIAPEKKRSLTEFVRARIGEYSKWHGGLFDLWVRAALLRNERSPEFDVLSTATGIPTFVSHLEIGIFDSKTPY